MSTLEQSKSQYSLEWSLPAKVLKVCDKVLLVQVWQGLVRQVPVSKVRVLQGSVPISLLPLTRSHLQLVTPPALGTTAPRHPVACPEWKKFLDEAVNKAVPVEGHADNRRRKRRQLAHSKREKLAAMDGLIVEGIDAANACSIVLDHNSGEVDEPHAHLRVRIKDGDIEVTDEEH